MTPPNTIYHYTDQAGLLGIVKSKSIWMAGIRYLNDAQEFIYTFDMVRKTMHSTMSTLPNRPSVLDKLLPLLIGLKYHDVFVACFSATRDHLSQWRAYGRGNSSYCVGVNVAKLIGLLQETPLCLVKCIYDETEQRALVDGIVAQFLSKISDISEPISWQHPAGKALWAQIIQLAPRLKHPSFESEQEFRLVSLYPDICDIRMRQGHSTLIPYHEARLVIGTEPLELEEIIVGPTPHPEIARDAVAILVETSHTRVGSISNSVSPFRSW